MAQLHQLQEFVCNSLECTEFKIIREPDDINEASLAFHPDYAHQIFGENECIFGYKELKVRIYYSAGPLHIYLGMKYLNRIDDFNQDGLKADDVMGKITGLITSGSYFTNIDEFTSKINSNAEQFIPFGEKLDGFDIDFKNENRSFEIYKCDINTPGFMAYHARLQTLILWFIDAASYIDSDDPQWTFFMCYEKYVNSQGKTLYATVGFTSMYMYYAYPANLRPRISQMLILPPFQKIGIGSKFVEVIYNHFMGDDKIIDITVEDPSDDFRRIRNYIESKLCKNLSAFSPDNLKQGFSKAMANEAREKCKINHRQSRTIYEILRLCNTNMFNEKEYKSYRLDVKRRLNTPYYKQKKDLQKIVTAKSKNLKNIESEEMENQCLMAGLSTTSDRIEQLKDEYLVIEEEYLRIIKRLNLDK